MESEKSDPQAASPRRLVTFASAGEADRRIAGVAAAGRIVRRQAEAGAHEIGLIVQDNSPLAQATLDDVERLRGPMLVRVSGRSEIADGEMAHAIAADPPPGAMDILRGTGKASDGLVSRLLNRRISQRVTWLVLKIPGARPVHVTIFNALLAIIMFPTLLLGGETGLLLGGILFQTASILDGVDGEMARATWRTSQVGATMDSVVDIATNLLFVTALTANLALRDGDEIGWIGAWAVALSIMGGILLGWRARAGGGPIGFDTLKRRSLRIRGPVDLIYWAVQTLTGRDCFAFLFMTLIMCGLERTALSIYAGVGTVWIIYVIASLGLARPQAGFRSIAS